MGLFGAVRGEVLTKLLTMILLSPVDLGALPDEGLAAAPRAGLVFFLTPPTGAGAAGRAVLRVERRPPAGVRLVERISSRDWSSLPDMLLLVVMKVSGKQVDSVERMWQIWNRAKLCVKRNDG